MRKFIVLSTIAFGLAALTGCNNDQGLNNGGGEWLIPANEIFDGGPGRDGIPALDNPHFVKPAEATYLNDNDLVIGIKIGNEVRAHPHPILDWHEITNGAIAGEPYSITYCPLTGSGMAWEPIIDGRLTTFGVSGMLYNTNLIPYDRATGSNWSQMKMLCVNGSRIGQEPEIIPVVETTWRTWKTMYPESKVLSTLTGFSKPYGQYPYGDYKTNQNRLLFPVGNSDSRLTQKERVLGVVVDGESKVYPMQSLPFDILVVNDKVNGLPVVMAGSQIRNFAVIYKRTLPDGTLLSFEPRQNSLPAVMVDNEGTIWDVFGNGISGPRAGQQLAATRSFIAYWFAWAAFYPDAEIHGQ